MQRHRQYTARDQGKEQVGDVIGGIKCVQGGRQAKLAVDQDLAQEAEGFFQAEEKGNDQSGAGNFGHRLSQFCKYSTIQLSLFIFCIAETENKQTSQNYVRMPIVIR